MTEPSFLQAAGTGELVLALLFAGHAAADFVFQTRSMVECKDRLRWLLAHLACVVAAHLVALLPVLSARAALGVAVIGATHVAIDLGKARLARRTGAPLRLFLLDQTLHVIVLLLVWGWITRLPPEPASWVSDVSSWTAAAWWTAAYAFNVNGAGSLIGLLLKPFAPPEGGSGGEQPSGGGPRHRPAESGPGRGRMIGILERILILTLLLVGQWGVVGFVLAAKSIARFDQLKDQAFAEYYLIGTLLSVLFAIGTGLLLGLV